jgi:hypothetical protein
MESWKFTGIGQEGYHRIGYEPFAKLLAKARSLCMAVVPGVGFD